VEHEWTTSAGRVEKEAVKKKFNEGKKVPLNDAGKTDGLIHFNPPSRYNKHALLTIPGAWKCRFKKEEFAACVLNVYKHSTLFRVKRNAYHS